MGNDSSKNGAGKYGQIFLQTDKSTYMGGETVTGRVYLNLLIPYPGNQLFLKFKGRELVQIVKTERVAERQPPKNPGDLPMTEFVDKHTLHKEKNTLIKMNVPIYTWSNLFPGQYTIPFAFMLPSHVPSSFHQQGNRYLANISYQLEAILEPAMKSDFKLKFKQPFVVRQPITNAQQGQVSEVTTQVKACCSSKGSNILKVNFEKNYYAPGEIAQVYMQLDNALATTNCSKILLTLKQSLNLSAGLVTEHKVFNKVVRELPGVNAGACSNGNYIALNLPIFQGRDYREIERHNIVDALVRQQEETMTLNPATKSRLIKSDYHLEVSCPMDGCCSTTPSTSIPIEIYYPEIKLMAISTPANWAPQIIESVNVSFGGSAPPQQQGGFAQQQGGFAQQQGGFAQQQGGFAQQQGGFQPAPSNDPGFGQGGFQPAPSNDPGFGQGGFQPINNNMNQGGFAQQQGGFAQQGQYQPPNQF